MPELYVTVVVEDDIHEALIATILKYIDPEIKISDVYGKRGNNYIKNKLSSFNNAAQHKPYIILTDLDDKTCPVQLLDEWITFQKHSSFIFRIAVREGETWILSDKNNFSKYLGVSSSLIDHSPEEIENPKEFIVNLVSKKSRRRKIREDIMPIGSSKVGPSYNTSLTEFIYDSWDINEARKNSPSLNKLIIRIQELIVRLRA